MPQMRERLGRWARTGRGITAILLALVLTAAAVRGPGDLLMAPVVFLALTVTTGLLLHGLCAAWERRTWPATPPFARRSAGSGSRKQLREDGNAELFSDHGGVLFTRRWFFTATGLPPVRISPPQVEALVAAKDDEPVQVAQNERRTWWWYRDAFYWENAGYGPRDVLALVTDRERRHQRQLERAHLLLDLDTAAEPRREPIPRDVREAVFRRDGGRCVQCGQDFEIQFDHVIPISMGGATTPENLQLLCGPCNREKGASL